MLGNPDRRQFLRSGIITGAIFVVLCSTLSAFTSLSLIGNSVGEQSVFESEQAKLKARETLKAETEKAVQDARAESGVMEKQNEFILTDWDTRRRGYWEEMERWRRTPAFQQYAAGGELVLYDGFRRKLGTYNASTGLICNLQGECR